MFVRTLFFIFIFGSCVLDASSVKVSISVPKVYEQDEIEVNVNITHQAIEKVDETSFTMQGKHLDAKRIGDGKEETGSHVISTYHFLMPGKAKGLYLLPPVSVKVGDQIARSAEVSYEVTAPVSTSDLGLEARIQEKGPYYPGQTVTFQYMITFAYPIVITKEKLPLLNFPKFRNVGEPIVDNQPTDEVSRMIITQKAKAPAAGTYSSGTSFIEGLFYLENAAGNKVYAPSLAQAQAKPIEIAVDPFPDKGMPASFRGAIGQFHILAKPRGSTHTSVGGKITLEVSIKGTGDFTEENFPDISRQKEFGDDFHVEEPKLETVKKDGTRIFMIDFRPRLATLTTIPSIEFSFFDPQAKKFITETVDKVAITVDPTERPGLPLPDLEGMPALKWPRGIKDNVPLPTLSPKYPPESNHRLLYAIVACVILYFAQQKLYQYLNKDEL